MRRIYGLPRADPAKSHAMSSNEFVPIWDFLSIAPAFSRSLATKANTHWRCPCGITGSFRRMAMLGVLLFLYSIPIAAQDSPLLTSGRIDMTILAGYRTTMGLPVQPETSGIAPTLSLDSGAVYGFAVGYRIRDEDLIEFRWTREKSYARVQQADVTLPTISVTTDQFHCNFSHEYVMPHREEQVRPYVVASVGATNLFSGSSYSAAHISVGIGGGIKFFVSKHIGFRMQAEWLPMFISPRQPGACTTACTVDVGRTASQAEVTFGPIIRF